MKFEKWTALGNDYAIVEDDALPWELTPERIRRICDRHQGVGSDGILLLGRPDDEGVVANLRIFNPDGSEAELSGNGAREAALYLRRAGWTSDNEFGVKTAAGVIHATLTRPLSCTIEIGRASTTSDDYPSGPDDGRGTLSAAGREWTFQHVSIGNPQCAIAVEDGLEDLDLAVIGPEIEGHDLFPNRTNVSFYRRNGDNDEGARIRVRIFERGVGETMSSGTGASGAAVAASLTGAKSPVTVELQGGELVVDVSEELDVRLSGPAEPLYEGELSTEFLGKLADA